MRHGTEERAASGKRTREQFETQPEVTNENIRQFKELLLELSARLISIHPKEIGREIDGALRVAGEFWGFDRILLAELSEDGRSVRNIHYYAAPGLREPPPTNSVDEMPWLMEKIRSGQTVVMPRLPEGLPKGAVADRRFCEEAGIRSGLTLPFTVGESVRGGLMFGSHRTRDDWPEELVKQLHFLAEILASALERSRAANQIDEVVRFEHLLSEISATYINLPTHEIENVVKRDLGRLGKLLAVDRCILYLVGKDQRFSKFDWPYFWFRDDDADAIKELDNWTGNYPNLFENLQYCFDKWYKGEHISLSRLEDLPPEGKGMKELYFRFGVKSTLSVPISVGGSTIGALVFTTTRSHRTWPEELIPRSRLFGEVFANAIMRKRSEESLRNALSEIKHLKERIEADYMYLREEMNLEHDFGDIVGKSEALRVILLKAKQVAPTNATVLLLGETGTGKGLIARAIHNLSKRKHRPLVQVNCAALSPSLVESELFGHEKGAFTGATNRRTGRFETAHGTTLFLDEIGELPPELQAKLLRVLQDGEFERVGGSATIKTDVRVIAATNRDLQKEVDEGRFRRDLWYRLTIFPIAIPPLRERVEDIPLFVAYFVGKYGRWIGKQFDMVPQRTIKALQKYTWPGNIRELENLIERAVITSLGRDLQIELPKSVDSAPVKKQTLAEFEREHILRTLDETDWKIEGPNGAARRLGLTPSTLRFRAKKLNIQRPGS